jgi:hypothetical protein
MTEFRLYFDNEPATREQLDQVERITVEQEIDMAWEARLEWAICVDEQGRWSGDDARFMQSFSRIRIEVRVGQGNFVPLIDGPVVGFDSARSPQPAQSSMTLVVDDDSVYLNRRDEVARFEDRSDSDIAAELFDIEQIATTDIDETPPAAGSVPPAVVQRGTAMQLLRALAQRHAMHAYVLPGDEPGQSVGAFKRLPTEPARTLPALVLLGPGRNLESLDIRQDAQRAADARTAALTVTDKGVVRGQASFRDLELLGPQFSLERQEGEATRIVRADHGDTVDPQQRAEAEARRESYTFRATGRVVPDCYAGVLRPYQAVSVRGINDRMSGTYVVRQVTHTLTRSQYAQAFELMRDAESAGEEALFNDPTGLIF